MPSPFWARHFDRRPFLLGRMRIAAALRQFFAARDFVEVETGTLVPSPGNETHLHAFASDLVSPADPHERLYLRDTVTEEEALLPVGADRAPDRALRGSPPGASSPR